MANNCRATTIINTADGNKFVSVEELAKHFNVSKQMIYRWHKRGPYGKPPLPSVYTATHGLMFNLKVCQNWNLGIYE